jgi:monovalent cation/hydrogen antiporter
MEVTGIVFVMLLAVVASRTIARLSGLPAPFVQIGLGVAIYYSSLTTVALDPDVFFLLLLPPLLFLDGWRIPKDDLLRDAGTIFKLAIGLVVFTVLGVGFLIHWLIPTLPLPVAFALAAVVSPTDPVAVSQIAARTPIPTRMRHILEGEALFNDASGLVCMRFAVAALLTGAFSPVDASLNFIWVAAGGLLIGTLTTWLVTRPWATSAVFLGDDGSAQIMLSLLIPSGVYLIAEYFHCSGILAAVAAGITMGFAPHSHWHAITRIRRTAVWDMVQFAANGSIFVLLGEQIPEIFAAAPITVAAIGHENPGWLGLYVLIIVLALALLRFIWVWISLRTVFGPKGDHAGQAPPPYWRLVLAMSFAGARGAITLAGVLTLPLVMADGSGFPGRDLAIFLATGVIVVSLLLTSVGLPHALRGLEQIPDPQHGAAENRLRTAASEAAVLAISNAKAAVSCDNCDAELYAEAAARIISTYRQRIARYAREDVLASQSAEPTQHGDTDRVEHQLRLIGLHAERDEVVRYGRANSVKQLILRKIGREIDLQEARYSA